MRPPRSHRGQPATRWCGAVCVVRHAARRARWPPRAAQPNWIHGRPRGAATLTQCFLEGSLVEASSRSAASVHT
eukprot:1885627-Pleurochrysis_carterae.AAC.3